MSENLPAAAVELHPQALLTIAVQQGAPIETLERLVALAKDVTALQARQAYNRAMAQFQHECPSIKKDQTARIQSRTGASYQYRYAGLDHINSVVLPILGPLELRISYRMRFEPDAVVATAVVSHALGHCEESGEVRMPIVQDGTGANPAQRVGIAATYAKRYALLAILGLAPEDDTDAGPGQRAPRQDTTLRMQEAAVRTERGGEQTERRESGGAPPQNDGSTISENQAKRFFAIAKKRADFADTKQWLIDFYPYTRGNSRSISRSDYDAICTRMEDPRPLLEPNPPPDSFDEAEVGELG